jgi:regulator of protease activity HflC (stomatin/prohibitin superfamily)
VVDRQNGPPGLQLYGREFGRYTRTLNPGLHILVPVMERVGAKMNMKEQVIDIPSQDIITTEAWGVKVTRIKIKDIAPPRDLVDSATDEGRARQARQQRNHFGR